jgi:hypothetical protein
MSFKAGWTVYRYIPIMNWNQDQSFRSYDCLVLVYDIQCINFRQILMWLPNCATPGVML